MSREQTLRGDMKFSGETREINTCGKGKENKQNWAMETDVEL